MPGWIPLRLRPLLGADLDEVTVESIQNLVGMREDRDLEFKRERYGTSDGQKKEAAYDVAALANASGGVIIIGMQEDGSDVAAGFVPPRGRRRLRRVATPSSGSTGVSRGTDQLSISQQPGRLRLRCLRRTEHPEATRCSRRR